MKKFDFTIVKNPEIVQENRLPVHSEHTCVSNWFEAEENSLRMSLDGAWKFSYAKNMDLAVAGFEEEAYSCKGWDEIRVPSNLQTEGYEVPYCSYVAYPWETTEYVSPGEIPVEFNPVASYVKYFTLPVNMRGERVCVSFQGVESGFAVWLNGHYVGYSENEFHPVEFELTPYLKEGENKIAVRMWKWTSGSWGRKQEVYSPCGIFGSVYLYTVPRTHLWDVQVTQELSEDLTEATLTIITTTCGKGEIEVRLLDDAMQEVLAGVMLIEEGEEGSDEIQSGIAGMVYEPKLWSTEKPNLYMLQLEVRDENGDLTEVTGIQVAFCRSESIDGKLVLNGKAVECKGVNYHECMTERGCVPSQERVEKDIIMMKQNNINAIYMSHPQPAYVYELCDIYGLYIDDKGGYRDGCSDFFDEIHAISPKMQEVKYNYQDISVEFTEKTFTVWNRLSFTNTDVFSAAVILQKDGLDIAKLALPIAVEPMERKTFDIPQQILGIMDNLKIASAVHDGGMPEFAVTVSFSLPADNMWGKRGHEVAFGQYIYKKEVLPYSVKEPMEVVKGENTIAVKGNHFKALFSNKDASLVSYVYGGVELLKSSPLPNFWRDPEAHKMDDFAQQDCFQWKLASLYARITSPAPIVEELGESITLTYTFSMPTIPASSCQVRYHVFGDGTIETTVVYDAVEGLCDMPEFGMVFKMDATHDHLCWHGLGPDATYTDHMEGGKLGIYQKKVAECFCLQDSENKCGVRYAEVTNAKGRGMRFFGDELSFCAVAQGEDTVVRVAQQKMDVSTKKVFTFCFRGV